MAERKKLLLRLDPEVYEAVARWAGDDLRSVNAQIEYALRMALSGAGRSPRPRRASAGVGENPGTGEGPRPDDGTDVAPSRSSGPGGSPCAGRPPRCR